MKTYLDNSQISRFSSLLTNGVINVVINNEKEAEDGALIEAMTNYWNVCSLKYMSEIEFFNLYAQGSINKNELYLYRNNTGLKKFQKKNEYSQGGPIGYYLTNDPVLLNTSYKLKNAPPYLYFSDKNFLDNKGNVNKGMIKLMIKNFNRELKNCLLNTISEKNAIFPIVEGVVYSKSKGEFSGKTILLVNSQVKKNEIINFEKTAESLEKYTGSRVNSMIIYSDDLDYAIKIEDSTVLLFNNGNLYSTRGDCFSNKKIRNQGGLARSNWVFLFLLTPVIAVSVFSIIVK